MAQSVVCGYSGAHCDDPASPDDIGGATKSSAVRRSRLSGMSRLERRDGGTAPPAQFRSTQGEMQRRAYAQRGNIEVTHPIAPRRAHAQREFNARLSLRSKHRGQQVIAPV